MSPRVPFAMERVLVSACVAVLACAVHAQVVLDGWFINERYVINTGIDLVASELDWNVSGNAPIRNYALDEPYYWVKRVYQRLELDEHPALTEASISDSIVPFVDLVNAALANGAVDAYKDIQFTESFERGACAPVVGSPIILKVDYTFDYATKMIVPHIIGLGFQQPDGRFVNFYFPELRWALMQHNVRNGTGLMRCNAFFDDGLYLAHPIDTLATPIALKCSNCSPQLEQQSELDALATLYQVEQELCLRNVVRRGMRTVRITGYASGAVDAHVAFARSGALKGLEVKRGERLLLSASYSAGKPNGVFSEFHADGTRKQEGQFDRGLREGEWYSWFENGRIRSHRTYANGTLHGQQLVYHANGELYMCYGMKNGDYEGEHVTWYPDGRLKQQGMMKDGFIIGEWTYCTRIDDALRARMDERPTAFSFPPSAWADNHITYRVTYSYEPDGTGCLLRKCLHSDIAKEVE